MINVNFDRNGNRFRFSCTGHAGFGKKGEDIVCSAATILSYTLAQAVKDRYEQGDFLSEPEISISDGKVTIQAEARPESGFISGTIFDTVQTGYEILAVKYPNCVKFRNFSKPG